MNLAKFLVLGALEALEEGSGYDINSYLEAKQVHKWTDIKKGSVYFAIKKLVKDNQIEEIRREQSGSYPVKNIYKITEVGKIAFDLLQEQAFKGLYPHFYGFKLALKFNSRKTYSEIISLAKSAVGQVDNILEQMSRYIDLHPNDGDDIFYIRNDIYLYKAEKKWLLEVIELYAQKT